MAVFVLNCPHCGVEKSSFAVWGHAEQEEKPMRVSISGHCSSCSGPVVAVLETKKGTNTRHVKTDLFRHDDFTLIETYPKQTPLEAPEALPDAVARAFIDGQKCRRTESWNAACFSYRRAMELGLKTFSPQVSAWKIEKRIDLLAEQHKITPELQAWAHQIRLDGNDAAHEMEEATRKTSEQMHYLCWFLLTYLYTLPHQIKDAQARRECK